MEDILTKVAAAAATTLVTGLLGRVFVNNHSDEKPTTTQAASMWALALLVGIGVFAALFLWAHRSSGAAEEASLPVLQSVIAKPNSVAKGDRVTLTVQLDRPAPRGGVSVALTSSDPAILTVDGNAIIPEGAMMGTGYSRAVGVPNYLSPVQIFAAYDKQTRQTEVNLVKTEEAAVRPRPIVQPEPAHVSPPPPAPAVKQPAAIDPELLGRLEDAQSRLEAEKGYWDRVSKNMLAGGSLRPEIRSQLYAAEAASKRCADDRQAANATSLQSCVDALNDHLGQLAILHN